ncbi:alpha/beta hydrolase-fold protein [Bacteroidota bacterium]|nr:alpha/beta hydrolase-fold protein [Bacteroidota bacterium]MDA9706777.1 alpha/beta hydrolase-fold protein [Bacteroidota bacterium]
MKKYILNTFLFFLTINLLSSQNLDSLYVSRVNDTILSKYLNEKRAIEIQLPRSYEIEVDKNYPLMIVLDGDYMFNIVSGSVDYLSYWGDIPENLVVGINQKDTRFQDSSVFDNITYTPISSTASFYDFIVNELIPYFSKNYRVSNFKVIVGQERTANFANFFLLKNDPQIRGVISISPKISENMNRYLKENLSKSNSKIVYTLSSSKRDFESIFKNVSELTASLDSIENKNLRFESLIFDKENHYILPSVSVPKSIRSTYSMYSDIDKIEYDSILSKLETSPINYLKNKYQLIKEFYDLDKTISMNDFMAIEEFIEENEFFNLYDELSELAKQEYPGTILPSYYKGRFIEETGDPEKAMHIYRSAYNMNEVKGLTKEYLLELAERIKEDFNY